MSIPTWGRVCEEIFARGCERGDFVPIGDGDVHLLIYMSILIDLLIFFREFRWCSHPFGF
jgi:hypothetical protein